MTKRVVFFSDSGRSMMKSKALWDSGFPDREGVWYLGVWYLGMGTGWS